MAEALICAKPTHWMDEETKHPESTLSGYEYERYRVINGIYPYWGLGAIKKAQTLIKLEKKYVAKISYQDFVEVRENGGFLTHKNKKGAGWRKDVFGLLIVSNAAKTDLKKFLIRSMNGEDAKYISRYKIGVAIVPGQIIDVGNLKDIIIIDKEK